MKVGDRVICLRDFTQAAMEHGKPIVIPIFRQIYTVRELVVIDGYHMLRLEEIVNELTWWIQLPYPAEAAFGQRYFEVLDAGFADRVLEEIATEAKRLSEPEKIHNVLLSCLVAIQPHHPQ